MKQTLLTLVAAFAVAGAALADHEPGHKVLVLKNRDGAAILGYDAVAYFSDNKAAKGNPKIQSEYEGGERMNLAEIATSAAGSNRMLQRRSPRWRSRTRTGLGRQIHCRAVAAVWPVVLE